MLELLEYIILGIIQGFTEPIPVSSSGHVMILNSILNTNIDIGLLAILTNFEQIALKAPHYLQKCTFYL